MTAREYLRLCGECMDMSAREIKERSEELLGLVGLADEKHRIKGFSRGMKQRLGVAQALLGSPKLLICDEPTSALDPIGRREILDVLISVRERTTVLFSTHILSDVESICTDVALLEGGRIAMQGGVSELKRAGRTEEFAVELTDEASVGMLLRVFPDAIRRDRVTLLFSGGEERIFEVLTFIGEKKLPLRKIERAEKSLESLFAEVVKK